MQLGKVGQFVAQGALLLAISITAASCNRSSSAKVIGGDGGGPPSQGGTGSMALDFLTAQTYTSLLVEVDYVEGSAPNSAALQLLRTRLQERCDKPGGVTIALDTAIPPPGSSPWTLAEIHALEQQHRSQYSSGTTAVLYILYLDGQWHGDTQNEKVLGLSYTGSSLAIFKDGVAQLPSPFTTQAIEEAMLVHEAGHALGLVNAGIPMVNPHEDHQHPGHDTNSACVMHHTINTSRVAQALGGIPNQYDAACIADMKAAGGR